MTRKQALMRAREILATYGQADEMAEITAKLQEVIAELPFIAWSESTIFDTIDQWILENGRIPNTRDLARKGLPPIPVIKNRFQMTARKFLDTYYPKPKPLCQSQRYGHQTKEEWLLDFAAQYQRICPRSAAQYNRERMPDRPAWATVASICGLKTWNELLAHCKLGKHQTSVPIGRKQAPVVFSIKRNTDLEQAYQKLDRLHD